MTESNSTEILETLQAILAELRDLKYEFEKIKNGQDSIRVYGDVNTGYTD